jgi:hypothetical protein
MVDFGDVEGIRNAIRNYYHKYLKGEREHSPVQESYSRKNLTRDLVTIFDTLIEKG